MGNNNKIKNMIYNSNLISTSPNIHIDTYVFVCMYTSLIPTRLKKRKWYSFFILPFLILRTPLFNSVVVGRIDCNITLLMPYISCFCVTCYDSNKTLLSFVLFI